jgi:hypothetical protein
MWTRIGISLLLAGGFLAAFSFVSRFMNADTLWADLCLYSLMPRVCNTVIGWFSEGRLWDGMYFLLYELPLYGILISAGVLCLAVSMVFPFRK